MKVALVVFQLHLLINSQNGHLLIVDDRKKYAYEKFICFI